MPEPPPGPPPAAEALVDLLRAAQSCPAERLAGLVDEHARPLGAARITIWLADQGQRHLVSLPTEDQPSLTVPVAVGPAGRAYRTGRDQPTEPSGDGTLWLALTASTERLGVLEVRPVEGMVPPPDGLAGLALVVAQLVLSKSLHSDAFYRARRQADMTLAAEMQWMMLPPLVSELGGVGVAGVLEPAYEVGGDAFDHALNDGVLHLAVFDAVGHDVQAAMISHVALSTYRHARRDGRDLAATAVAIDAAVSAHVGDGNFVTGVLAQIDCHTGTTRWLDVAHPTPLITRGAGVEPLAGPVCRPFGLDIGRPQVQELSLGAGEWLLLYTDGVLDERVWRDQDGAQAWLAQRLLHHTRPERATPADLVHHLMLDTIAGMGGARQRDDAALLAARWHRRDQD